MKYILILIYLVVSMHAGEIRVALSANVSYAIDDLLKEFYKTHKNITVKVNIGSSGNLTAQIKNSAPFDIFMSANMSYPKALYINKIALTAPKIYAKGSLALLSTKKQDFSQGLKLLKSPKIKKIAIANPKIAPYGVATIQALKNTNIYKQIKNKLVFGQSISQTVAYTLKATDIGFIAKSTLFNPKLSKYKKGTNWIEVDSSLYTPISQGIVLLSKKEDAKTFYDFILSQKAKLIFKKYGYIVE